MDRPALETLNQMLGNTRNAAAFEWALNGGALEFRDNTTFALGGAKASCTLGDSKPQSYTAINARAGDVLQIDRLIDGRFLYIAIAGGIACEAVLGSRSTCLAGGFGGIDGRRLQTGDQIETGVVDRRGRHQVVDALPLHLQPPRRTDAIRFIARHFDAESTAREFAAATYTISAASDRTGFRLDGSTLAGGRAVTSEAMCPGAIQLPPGGTAIVLMADAPTIGGYQLVGSVITADLASLAQKVTGERVTFADSTVRAAQAELNYHEEKLRAVAAWAL